MRGWQSLVAGVVACVLLVVPVAVAGAEPASNPVIESPVAGAAHYNGFNGPFVVNFEGAPPGTYDYVIKQNANLIWEASEPYNYTGSFTKPQFRVGALPPGTGYSFHVTHVTTDTYTANLEFTVLSGAPPTCSILLPGTVRMKARSALVTATLSSTCATLHTTYAVWKATHPVGGFAQTFTFDQVDAVSWRIYDDEYTGLYTVGPVTATSSSNEDLPQNTRRLTMKMDSRINLTASRSGAYVTLRTVSTRYSPSANRYKVWSGRRVVLSYRACGTCGWHRLKVRTTNRYGKTSYRFRATKARQYRATAAGTSITWAPRADYISR